MGPPSGLFAELGRWRDKAIKRGKVTHFNSDIIPDWLNAELVAAQGAVGPDAAFSFLKQVPLSVRMKAEREIKRKIQAILGKYESRAARSIKRGEEFDYAGMADELRAAVLPELSSLMVDNTLRLSVDTGISFDPAVINTEALRWARNFSTEWAQGLSETTRKQLQEAMSAFIQTPGMTMGDITRLIEPAFGPLRADMIASTEVTRAYSMATNETQALLRAETPDLTTTRVWNTMEDERVCFPAWTMVDTEAGPRAIQDIEPGEMARTRAGYRRVMTTNERKYSGRMIRIETEDRAVEATASHLFWTAEQEWTQASELKPGHTLQLVNGIAAVIQQVVDMYSVALPVYNLQVEVPEYFANGVLVHNCPICGPLEGAPEEEWRTEFPNGPPAHPRCRCGSSIRFESKEQLEAEFGERQAEREAWMRAEGLWTEPVQIESLLGPDTTTERVNQWLARELDDVPWWKQNETARGKAKAEIVDELYRRHAAQGGKLSKQEINEFIEQWSLTSGDGDMRAWGIQRDASLEFDTPLSSYARDRIGEITTSRKEQLELLLEYDDYNPRGVEYWERHIAETMPAYNPLYDTSSQRDLLRHMYDYTQESLAQDLGSVGTIRLRRGIGLPESIAGNWKEGDIIDIAGNPLESWSAGERVASSFASGAEGVGVVLEADVPLSSIIGSARSGFGCLREGEFVVTGRPMRARILSIIR